MEKQLNRSQDETVIDLKSLFFYILKRWKSLLALAVVGAVLGGCVGMFKPAASIENEKLNYQAIEQYARYHELFENQKAAEKTSVLMNMDPYHVHSGEKVYFITVGSESDMHRAEAVYTGIGKNNAFFEELAKISGLECTDREIQDLVSVEFSSYQSEEIYLSQEDRVYNARISIGVDAPTEEACRLMTAYVDELVMKVNSQFAAEMEGFSFEVVAESCQEGYSEVVQKAREQSTKKLNEYLSQMTTLKKTLTNDDIAYYEKTYTTSEDAAESGSGLGWLKWSVVVGVLLCGVAVIVYGVRFMLDDHIKTENEISDRYSLYRISVLSAADEPSAAYILQYLKAVGCSRVQLCADAKDAEAWKTAGALAAQNDAFVLCSSLSADGLAMETVSTTDGAVLFVHLWKTTHAALERELEVMANLGQKVLGVIVLK